MVGILGFGERKQIKEKVLNNGKQIYHILGTQVDEETLKVQKEHFDGMVQCDNCSLFYTYEKKSLKCQKSMSLIFSSPFKKGGDVNVNR